MSAKAFVLAIAKYNHLNLTWIQEGRCALLHEPTDDGEVKRCLADVKSAGAETREAAVRLAGYLSDPRLVRPLVSLAGGEDKKIAAVAEKSLARMGWLAVVALGGAPAEEVVVRIIKSDRFLTAHLPRGSSQRISPSWEECPLAQVGSAGFVEKLDETLKRRPAKNRRRKWHPGTRKFVVTRWME